MKRNGTQTGYEFRIEEGFQPIRGDDFSVKLRAMRALWVGIIPGMALLAVLIHWGMSFGQTILPDDGIKFVTWRGISDVASRACPVRRRYHAFLRSSNPRKDGDRRIQSRNHRELP